MGRPEKGTWLQKGNLAWLPAMDDPPAEAAGAAEGRGPRVGEMSVRLCRDQSGQHKGQKYPGLFLLKLTGNPKHRGGLTVAELRKSSAQDERKKIRVDDRVTQINGAPVGTFQSLEAVKEYIRTQETLMLHVERREVQLRQRGIRREARNHLEGVLFQQPQLAALVAHVPAAMPADWYDTLDVRVHTLSLLATAAGAAAAEAAARIAANDDRARSEIRSEDVDALWRSSYDERVAREAAGVVDGTRKVWIRLQMVESGDSKETEGQPPIFDPSGIVHFRRARQQKPTASPAVVAGAPVSGPSPSSPRPSAGARRCCGCASTRSGTHSASASCSGQACSRASPAPPTRLLARHVFSCSPTAPALCPRLSSR